MASNGKKRSVKFWIRLISGVSLLVLAVVLTVSFMVPSWLDYKSYYDALVAEREYQAYLNGLPLEFLGISAELSEGVVYYDNESAYPIEEDFEVKANFTEKGRDFSKKLYANDYSISVPANFAKDGGVITVSYLYTPEKGKDDTEEPQPVEYKTEVNITLVAPDATVFKIIEEPTFTADGYAENILNEKRTLPALNLEDYDYSERRDIATFIHNETGVAIRKTITDTVRIYADGKTYDRNNVDCHFISDVDGLSVSYDNGFVLTSEDGKTVSLDKLDTGSIVLNGGFEIHGNITVPSLTIETGADVNVNGIIETTCLIVEKDGALQATAGVDTVKIKGNNGIARLYGTITLTKDGNQGSTGIWVDPGVNLEIGKDSNVTVNNYDYAIGQFGNTSAGNAFLYIPYPAVQKGASIKSGDNFILQANNCKQSVYARITVYQYGDYDVLKEPTLTEVGLARHKDSGEQLELPALNLADYTLNVQSSGQIRFAYKDTFVPFYVSVEDASLTMGDLTIAYSSENKSYTFTVGDGKTVSFDGDIDVSGCSVIFKGEGTFNTESTVTTDNALIIADNLLVERGFTLNVKVADRDAAAIKNGGEARLFGTVSFEKTGGKGKTGIMPSDKANFYLTADSRVTFKNFNQAFGMWSGKALVYVPDTAVENNKKYTVGANTILDASTCNNVSATANVTVETYKEYTVEKAPTATEAGLATHFVYGEEVTLSAFNCDDYLFDVRSDKIGIIHNNTGLSFEVALGDGPQQISDGVTVEYSSADKCYTFTAESGKTMTLSGGFAAETDKVVFDGEGQFKILGNVTVTDMTVKTAATVDVEGAITVTTDLIVEKGCTLKATANTNTISITSGDGSAQLYGTVVLTAIRYHSDTGINVARGVNIVLGVDSRLTFSRYNNAFGQWIGSGDAYVYVPEGAKIGGATIEDGKGTTNNNAYKQSTSITVGETAIVDTIDCGNEPFGSRFVFKTYDPEVGPQLP